MRLLQAGDEGMLRVEFENPFPDRNRLSGSPVHARERRCDAEGVGYQAGRRLGQARGQPHFLDMITQGLLQPGQQVGEIPLLLLALGLVRRLFILGVEVHLALGYRLQRFAVELGHRSHPDLVDRVGEQQHLVALRLERLEMRRLQKLLTRLSGGVKDLLLTVLHALDVLGQGGGFLVAVGRGERRNTQQQCLGCRSPTSGPL